MKSSGLYKQKGDKGMGFQEMEAFNEALLAKQLWRIMKDETSLVARILKAKYYPNCHLLEASQGCTQASRGVVSLEQKV